LMKTSAATEWGPRLQWLSGTVTFSRCSLFAISESLVLLLLTLLLEAGIVKVGEICLNVVRVRMLVG